MTEQEVIQKIKNNEYSHSEIKQILIDRQSEKICLVAVKKNPFLIQYVENQTEQVCLSAVKQEGDSIGFIKNQTEKVCLEAIKQNPLSLRRIEKQSPEICMAAVQKDGRVLHVVKSQTVDICIAALNESPFAPQYVKIVDNPDHKTTLKKLINLKNKQSLKSKIKELK